MSRKRATKPATAPEPQATTERPVRSATCPVGICGHPRQMHRDVILNVVNVPPRTIDGGGRCTSPGCECRGEA